MKNKNIKKLAISSILGLFALIFAFSGTSFTSASASSNSVQPLKSVHTERDLTPFVEGCEEVSPSLLRAKVSKSNTAQSSKFIQVTFSTPVPKAFSNADKDYYSVVTSSEYTGDTSDYKSGDNKKFDGSVIRILNKSRSTLYIASSLKFGTRFTITNTDIAENAMFSETDPISYQGIDNIYIPKTIKTIGANAFKGCTDVDFYFEWNSNDSTHTIDPSWSSVPSNKMHFLDSATPAVFPEGSDYDKKFNINTNQPEKLDGYEDTPFILNYAGLHTPNFEIGNYPLVYSYTMVGSNEIIYDEVELQSKINIYDAVGSKIVDVENTIELTINFDLGEDVDTESLTFYDIHEATWTSNLDADLVKNPKAGIYIPGTMENKTFKEGKKYMLHATMSNNCQTVDVSRVISYEYGELKKFNNYFTVSWNVDLVLPSLYEEEGYGKSYLEQYASYFEKGQYVIRHGFTSLSNTILNVIYYDKTNTLVHKEVPIKTDDSIIELWNERGNIITFLVCNSDVADDFSISKIRSVQIDRVTVTMDIFDKNGNQKVKGTSVNVKFGSLDIMPRYSKAPAYLNIDLVIILTFAIFVPLYCLIACGLFFFMKNKYKNDEFRRVKPKVFLKKSLIGLLGGCIVVGMIIFIISRFGLLNHSIAVYNPLDMFVVFFSLVGIVVTGLFIKTFVVMIKTAKERRETIRLHMNDDVDDDGTK